MIVTRTGERWEGTGGTAKTADAYGSKRSAPLSVMTMGMELWALKIATSLTESERLASSRPAALMSMSGSALRSMCFLSSMKSQDIDL